MLSGAELSDEELSEELEYQMNDRPDTNGGNGTADVVEFEDSSPIHAALPGIPKASDIAKALIDLSGGGASAPPAGSVPPEVHKKQIKRHNWAAVVLAMLLGPGGAFAVINTMDDRSKANEMKVEQVEKSSKSMDERVEKVEDDVRYIKVRVGDLDTKVDRAMVQQQVIVEGIEQLKEESVRDREKRLREENERLRDRLRRRSR